jgi:hypothetical protein
MRHSYPTQIYPIEPEKPVMSNSHIPKASRSKIVDLVVTPDTWDAYPVIERSHITSCSFSDLNSSTAIERSHLTEVKLSPVAPAAKTGSKNGKSVIERSNITSSEVQESRIERSNLTQCVAAQAGIERSMLTACRITGPKVRVERSTLDRCEVREKSTVQHSTGRKGWIEESKIDHSTFGRVTVRNSKVDWSQLKECDIEGCKMKRSRFTGMYMRNGVWEGNDLVGRVDNKKEVIIRPLTEDEKWREVSCSFSDYCISGELQGSFFIVQIQEAEPEGSQRPVPPPPATKGSYTTRAASICSSTVSLPDDHLMGDEKSLLDQPGTYPYYLDRYEGPEDMDVPPPYQA